MLVDMLKGLLVGVCASAPVGPIAILVVQKSLSISTNIIYMVLNKQR